jgi:hypothetical protein
MLLKSRIVLLGWLALGCGAQERDKVYRLDTTDYRIEMTVQRFPSYVGGRLVFYNSTNPGKEQCYSGNGNSSSCMEHFVGALAVVTYRFQPRRKHLPSAATFREVVKVLSQSAGLDERPSYIREQPLVKGVGSDIQAFGYDESAVAEPERAAVRAESRARMWRIYQQELFLNGDSEPFGVVEWKHTLSRIEVVRATGRLAAIGQADAIDRALDRLRYIEPLPRLTSEQKAQVIAALPTEGEVKTLTAPQRKKVAAVAPVLRAHGSEADYLLKVVESPQARVALHARFVVLMTDTALRVLTPAQLQAVISHEIGHAYFWDEYEAAQKAGDWSRSRELELSCDGVAILTLRRLGATPESLVDGLRALEAANQVQGLTSDPTRHSHPSIAERARFVRELAKRLAAGVSLCPQNLKDTPDAEVCLWTRQYSGGPQLVLR